MSDLPDVSVVVPTLDGGKDFAYLARHLQLIGERYGVEVLIIDSGSRDDTVDVARRAGLRVHEIDRGAFSHGGTRNLGLRMTRGATVCYLTQDVLPCSPDWPVRFEAILKDPSIAGVYGRQVPRNARTMEMFFVALNYPAEPILFTPTQGDPNPRPGRVLFSNAFSAVRRDVAEQIPFVEDVPVSEDQVWARQALRAGYCLRYEPAAEALHAHVYTLPALFRRTYLVGQALRRVNLDRGATLPESVRFLATELRYFIRQGHSHRLPQLLLYEAVRWAGFQWGRRSVRRSPPATGAADSAPSSHPIRSAS